MIKSKCLTDMSQATPWWLPSTTGFFFGFVFFVLTFTPSLVPRPPVFQGLLGGLAFFIGYAIGHCGVLLWCYLELPEDFATLPASGEFGTGTGLRDICCHLIPQAAAWQNEARNRMHMPPAETANLLQVSVVAAIVAVLLVLLAGLLIPGIRGASSVVYRWVPKRIAAFLGAAIFAVLLVTVVNGTLVSATIGAIDRAQALVDVTNPPVGVGQRGRRDRVVPALRSRGRMSAEPASDVTEGPRKADIEAFNSVAQRSSPSGSTPGPFGSFCPRTRLSWRSST